MGNCGLAAAAPMQGMNARVIERAKGSPSVFSEASVTGANVNQATGALNGNLQSSAIKADGRDLAYVEVDIVDAQGVVAPKANDTIAVSVTGPGTLVGLDAGDSTNHDSYKGTSHAAFSGKLMAIVRSTTTPGTITVTASSGSLTAGSAVVTATP